MDLKKNEMWFDIENNGLGPRTALMDYLFIYDLVMNAG